MTGTLTFGQMVEAATTAVPAVEPAEVRRRLADPQTLVVDVRDQADIAPTGKIPGAVNVSYAALPYKADHEVPEAWREATLADRSRPVITTCAAGTMGALAAKLLHDMGFSNVSYVAGGIQAWKAAGFPVE